VWPRGDAIEQNVPVHVGTDDAGVGIGSPLQRQELALCIEADEAGRSPAFLQRFKQPTALAERLVASLGPFFGQFAGQ